MLRGRYEITKNTIKLVSCTELDLIVYQSGLVPNLSCTEMVHTYRNGHFMYRSGMYRNSLVQNWSYLLNSMQICTCQYKLSVQTMSYYAATTYSV